MDFGTIWENAPLIGAVIVLILLQFFLRKPKPQIAEREVVQNLLSEVRLNQALVEAFFSPPAKAQKTRGGKLAEE